jgi:hypothetical protein
MEPTMTKHLPQKTPAPPALRRLARGAALMLAMFIAAPTAHAQWAVVDTQANGTLGSIQGDTSNIATNTDKTATNTDNLNQVIGKAGDTYKKDTVNGRLDAINQKLVIGTYDENKPGPRVADPAEKLPKPGGTALNDGTNCKTVADPQQATCKQIVALQNAQYQYMLTMYENTNTRDTMLRKLLDERKDIKSDDPSQYGKLEDNTNKLTALYNLIALDQQQMQTVNYAYEANIAYLRAKQTVSANAAASGKDPTKSDGIGGISIPGVGNVGIGDLIGNLSTGFVLQGALEGVKSDTPSGMKTLHIGNSNGF